MKYLKYIFIALLLITSLSLVNPIYAEDNNNDDNVMYWGINNGTLYLSPTKQGYAINEDARDTLIKDDSDLFIELFCDWWKQAESIKTVEILTDGDIKIKPQSIEFWFYDLTNCIQINGLNNLDTSNLESCFNTFGNCESLEEINLDGFDTSNVSNLSYFFSNCSSLMDIDVTSFDTHNVTDFSGMFGGCKKIEHIDVTNFDTSNAISIGGMFGGCLSLKDVDLSSFNTQNVKIFDMLFYYCPSLEKIDLSNFDFGSAEGRLYCMFQNCSKLKSIDLSNFKTENIDNYISMFNGCSSLKELDLSSFDTKKMRVCENMFAGCTSLEKIIVSDKWVEHKYLNDGDENMFLDCINLVGQSGTKYDENNIGIEYAKVDEGEENPGYFTLKTIDEPIVEENTIDNSSTQIIKPSFSLYAIISVLILCVVGVVLNIKKKQ